MSCIKLDSYFSVKHPINLQTSLDSENEAVKNPPGPAVRPSSGSLKILGMY